MTDRRPRVQQYQHNMHRVCKVTKLDKSYLEVLSTVQLRLQQKPKLDLSNIFSSVQAYTAKHYSLLSILWKYFMYTKNKIKNTWQIVF